jgi:hypothetical protein
VVDFTDPTSPREVAYYDIAPSGVTGGDNWSAYWYEGPRLGRRRLTIYASDGVDDPAARFDHLNPQTQERPRRHR